MEVLQNIHAIVAVAVIVLLDIAAVVKAVSVIVQRTKSVQQATEEEKAAAKENIKANLWQIIFGLVTDAEKDLGSGTGKLKSAKVAGWIYDKIPDELKPLFTAEEIQDMIDSALREAQEYWNKNSKAREYIESGTGFSQVINATLEGSPAAGVPLEQLMEAVAGATEAALGAFKPQDVKTPAGDQSGAERPPDAATEAETEGPTE